MQSEQMMPLLSEKIHPKKVWGLILICRMIYLKHFFCLLSELYALQRWLEKLDAGLFQEEFLCCSSFQRQPWVMGRVWTNFSVVNYDRKGCYTNDCGITVLVLWSRLDVESFLLSYWHNVPKGVIIPWGCLSYLEYLDWLLSFVGYGPEPFQMK